MSLLPPRGLVIVTFAPQQAQLDDLDDAVVDAQDTATIDHSGGSVVFTLLKNVTNASTCTGGATVYGPTASINVVDTSGKGTGPFRASTSNTTFSVTSVTAGDTYHWKAEYTSGDASHKNVASNCQEATGFSSLSNGSPVTSP